MNGHDRIRYLLSSALEFQLSTPESQMVDEHLARCSACRAFATAIRSDMAAARAWPMPTPSARLEAAVVAMAVSPARVRVGAPTRTVAFAWAAVLALLFAALIGLAIAGAPQLERLLANIVPAPSVAPQPVGGNDVDPPAGAIVATFQLPVGNPTTSLCAPVCGATGTVSLNDSIWTTYADGIARVDPQDGETQLLPVGRRVTDVVAVDGSLWVTVFDEDRIARVDPGSMKTTASVAVGDGPVSLAADGDSLWVADYLAGTVDQVSIASGTVVASIHVDGTPNSVAARDGAAWVTNSRSIVRIGADRSVTHVPNTGDFDAIAASPETVWATNNESAHLVGFDPQHDGARTLETLVHFRPSAVEVDHDTVWVLSTGSQVISHFDPATGVLRSTGLKLSDDPYGAFGGSIAVGDDGWIWVMGYTNSRLYRIQPAH